jgi:DNA-binding SARP family transcriptional activator
MPSADNEKQTPPDLIAQSHAYEQAGDVSRALRQANQALELARSTGDRENLPAALVLVGGIHYHLGHFGQAQDLAREALDAGSRSSLASAEALRILGNCAHEEGDLAAAETFFHQAIDLARTQGFQRMLQSCLHSLSACVYLPRGQFELALAADEEALRLAMELGLHDQAWYSLDVIGWIHWLRGQRGRSLAAVEQMGRFIQPGSLGEGYYLCLRGDLATDGEDLAAAGEFYTRARSIAEQVGEPGLNAEVRLGFSRWQRAAGNAPAAYRWAEDALVTAQRAGSADLQGWALIERALAGWALGDLGRAQADLNAASEILTPLQAHFDLARIRFYQAALYQQAGRPEAGAAWLEAVEHIVSGGYSFFLEKERSLAFPLLAHHLNSRDARLSAVSNRLMDEFARVPPPPLRITALGRFEVHQGRQVISEQAWRQRKAGELFRLLLIRPRRSALRDQVIQDLWPDKPPSSAQALFHQATSALRKALEPDLPEKFPSRYLVVDHGGISLRLPEGSQVDYETFEAHIANQDWSAALALYQGDLFPGDVYSDWSVEKREQLKQSAIEAAMGAASQALQAGQPALALEACLRALAMEPWQEEAVLLGMQAYMAQKDRAGAIRLYRKLERALKTELDVAPQEVVQAYYQSLRTR